MDCSHRSQILVTEGASDAQIRFELEGHFMRDLSHAGPMEANRGNAGLVAVVDARPLQLLSHTMEKSPMVAILPLGSTPKTCSSGSLPLKVLPLKVRCLLRCRPNRQAAEVPAESAGGRIGRRDLVHSRSAPRLPVLRLGHQEAENLSQLSGSRGEESSLATRWRTAGVPLRGGVRIRWAVVLESSGDQRRPGIYPGARAGPARLHGSPASAGTNGPAGGKQPGGKSTVRSPARSRAAASR